MLLWQLCFVWCDSTQVSLDLKKCGSDGEVRDFLHAEVKTITVDLTERTWDRQGTLRIESVDVVDYCTKGRPAESLPTMYVCSNWRFIVQFV